MARYRRDGIIRRPDTLAVEEPLEIHVNGAPYTVTMRTPGHDLDLALGFLVGEGVISAAEHVTSARHCPDAAADAEGLPTHNVVEVQLGDGVEPPAAVGRRLVSSACGVCGAESVAAVGTRSAFEVAGDPLQLPAAVLAAMPARLRDDQRVFDRTGGLHAAGLFTPDGHLMCLREDVGRHNAVDKVVGWALAAGRLPLTGLV